MQDFSIDNRIKTGFFITAGLVFLILALRNAWVPFNHDETATFFYYIQSGEFMPYEAHVDANNHVLNSALGYYSFKLFGDSPFALRLPNLLSFLLLAFGVYRLLPHFKNKSSQILLITALLLSFHWLSFFNTARGYGMSMALFVLALAFLMDYLKNFRVIFFYGIILCLQLGISANLTLILPTVFITGIIIFYQVLHRKIADYFLWPGMIAHFFLFKYWIDFSFFLKESNALYYGQGDSYWEVTFKSFIGLMVGTENSWVAIGITVFFIVLFFISLYFLIKNNLPQKIRNADPLLIFAVLMASTVFSFWLLNVWKDVNYPEDRTALFFYPLAVLMVLFFINHFREYKFYYFISILFVLHFLFSLNFSIHSMPEYETFPDRFYTRLVEEQEKQKERITIAGHRVFELMFAFKNYRNGSPINFASDGEEMNTWCDYGISKKEQFSKYADEFEIIDEAEWDFILLKRKKPIHTSTLFTVNPNEWREGQDEFFEFFRLGDTLEITKSPLKIEFNFDIDHAAQPFYGWLVVQIEDAQGKNNIYQRLPMNWIKYSLNQTKNAQFSLVTPELPENIKSMVIYLWNTKKQFIRVKMNTVKIKQLYK